MNEHELAEMRRRNEESRELAYRYAMRRSNHKRWQRGREWDGGWENPVPDGEPVSVWYKGRGWWNFHRYAGRVDWTQIRAYRLEHGTPYPDVVPVPVKVSPELAGVLPPVLEFRLNRIDAALAQLLALHGLTTEGAGA